MSYKLSKHSLDKLQGVDPALVNVVKRAIELTEIDFGVTEGVRTVKRQQHLVDIGASYTMKSKHLVGQAVDLVAYDHDGVSWAWPLYDKIAEAMKAAATELDTPITWGGDWRTFKDGPHFQLKLG